MVVIGFETAKAASVFPKETTAGIHPTNARPSPRIPLPIMEKIGPLVLMSVIQLKNNVPNSYSFTAANAVPNA